MSFVHQDNGPCTGMPAMVLNQVFAISVIYVLLVISEAGAMKRPFPVAPVSPVPVLLDSTWLVAQHTQPQQAFVLIVISKFVLLVNIFLDALVYLLAFVLTAQQVPTYPLKGLMLAAVGLVPTPSNYMQLCD